MNQDLAQDGTQIQCPYYSPGWTSYSITPAYLVAGVLVSSQF